MPMRYTFTGISDTPLPQCRVRLFQHAIETYASETNKIGSVWTQFGDDDLAYRPHPRASSVEDIVRHQLLSERRFFGEFLGAPEPAASAVLPATITIQSCVNRLIELALPRIAFFAERDEPWWVETVPFFDVARERAWIFWRRVLHSTHHRTQLTVYLRMLDRPVPATYGPTADASWEGADPTNTVAAAGRSSRL
ncbi:MAG TPA: DinB family protein [Gemmatimonadaceae bacterium]|nr:DinB family protein [Gemmatimonadaceae bacterium]